MTRSPYPFERSTAIWDSLTAAERARCKDVRQSIQLALARRFPDLPESLVNATTRDCITDKQLFLTIVGADGGPTSQSDYDEIARELVLGNELAVRAINLADDTRVQTARSDALAALSPSRRIAMLRDQTLDAYLDSAARQTVLTDAHREKVAL